MQSFRLIRGHLPLLVSIPHMGVMVPGDIRGRMTPEGRRLPDTDWHLDRLYDFARQMGASILMSVYSRYVIDLNRSTDDATLYPGQVKTGLVPLQTFAGEDIYQADEEPDSIENVNRIGAYWYPYHDALKAELARMRDQFGYALLYDAHSIKSEVPRLFDGVLPDLNIGTVHGASCDTGMEKAVAAAASHGNYHAVQNGRFVGGYITRAYGRPDDGVHAVQMEIACRNYMDENSFAYDEEKAGNLSVVLQEVMSAMLSWGEGRYAASSKEK